MKRGPSKLASAAFLCLDAASAAAVGLCAGRGGWGSTSWFPAAVGFTAALALVPLLSLLANAVHHSPAKRWGTAVFFFLAGPLPFASFPFLGRDDLLLVCGAVAFSLLLFWAAFGTLFRWPGFRPPAAPDDGPDACPCCGCDLADGDGGACPECGTAVGPPDC